MNSYIFWLAITQPSTWSLSDVLGQFACAMACVACAVCIGATLHWYFDRCDQLNRAKHEIDALEKALMEMRRVEVNHAAEWERDNPVEVRNG